MMNESIVTECITCQAPLGNDSRNEGFPVCHTHRKCTACKFDVSVPEIEYCLGKGFPIKHARCLCLQDAQGPFATQSPAQVAPESLIELLNLATLMITPDRNLSVESHEALAKVRTEQLFNVVSMTLEDKFLFLRTVQAVAAVASLCLKKDKVAIQNELKMRSAVKAQEVLEEVKVKNRTPSDKRKLDKREKAIAALVSLGLSESDAAASVDSGLKGRSK